MATVRLTWTDNSTNETGFKLWKAYGTSASDYTTEAAITAAAELGTGSGGADGVVTGDAVTDPKANATSYDDSVTDTSLTHAFYVLRSYNSAGDSAAATTAALADYLHVEVTH